MRYCIGIDLGGTNIAGGIADLDGKLLLTDSIKTGCPARASDIADRIALLCRRMATALGLALSDAAWVGIGCARQRRCGHRHRAVCQQSGI